MKLLLYHHSLLLLGVVVVVVVAVISGDITTANAMSVPIPTKEEYLVHGLDEIEPAFATFQGDMYAGLVPTTLFSDITTSTTTSSTSNETTSTTIGKLMFWLFVPDNVIHDDTIVIWLNGGPGCSSFAGCLFEHGPVTIPLHPAGFYGTDDDPKILQPNVYAWTNATIMLYVEQPHSVGFGSGPDPTTEIDVGHDFYHFLQNLYTIFRTTTVTTADPTTTTNTTIDDTNVDNDTSTTNSSSSSSLVLDDKRLFLFGESYAGMYVPSIAHYIHQENKKIKQQQQKQQQSTTTSSSSSNVINLQGIGVGNGWIDVMIQGPTVIDFLWWHGMLDLYTAKEFHQSWANCIGGVPQRHPFHNFTTPDECGVGNVALLSAGDNAVEWGSPNVYDITTYDK
jgi:carboxypeptidase C (cathepsin A)